MGDQLYWVCGCGAWTWASKGSCVGCDARPPRWVSSARQQKRQPQPQRQQEHHAPRRGRSSGRTRQAPAAPPRASALAADGSAPTTAMPLGAWVQQPAGGRRQAKARRQAAELAASGARSSDDDKEVCAPSTTTAPDDDELMVDSGDDQHDDESGADLATRLASAKDCVQQLEAMGENARKAFPDFVERLAEARKHRDLLQRERRAARPVRWRLVEAERLAKSKATAVDKASAELDELQLQLEKLQGRVAEQRLALERAKLEREQAEEAVAAVRDEIAREASPQRPEPGQRAAMLIESAATVAKGIAQQVAALPAALAANNAEAALVAIQVQTDALLAAVLQAGEPGAAAAPPGPPGGDSPSAASAGAPAGAPATPPTRPPDGAAGTPRDDGATPPGHWPRPGETPQSHTGRRATRTSPMRRSLSFSRSRSGGYDDESEPEEAPRPRGLSPGQRTLTGWVRRPRSPQSGASQNRG